MSLLDSKREAVQPALKRMRRPPNSAQTKATIFESAKVQFASASYDEISVQSIAVRAGTSVSMIGRYFGSKEGLFTEVVKELMDPQRLQEGDRATFGTRFSAYLALAESTDDILGSVLLILRSTMSPTALSIVRDINDDYFAKPFSMWLGGDDAILRAHLIQSTLLGMLQARIVNTSLSSPTLNKAYASLVGKWLQRLVDGIWETNISEYLNLRRQAELVDSFELPNRIPMRQPDGTIREFGYLNSSEDTSNGLEELEREFETLHREPPHTQKPEKGRRNSRVTRAAIIESAVNEFTAASYESVGLRAIADGANVDVALISRYFGSKNGLFMVVVKELMDPRALLEGNRSTFGLRIAEAIYGSRPTPRSLMNIFLILRSTMSPAALPIVRDINSKYFAEPIAEWLGGDQAELRAQFITTAIYGSMQTRLLDKSSDPNGLISIVSQWQLAEWLQSIVDNTWHLE